MFGVCCEGVPKQVDFMIDETHLISKVSNARPKLTFTATTALDKTRTVLSCGTVHGGFPSVSTKG